MGKFGPKQLLICHETLHEQCMVSQWSDITIIQLKWYYNDIIISLYEISLYEIIFSKFLSGRWSDLQHLSPAAGGSFSTKKKYPDRSDCLAEI